MLQVHSLTTIYPSDLFILLTPSLLGVIDGLLVSYKQKSGSVIKEHPGVTAELSSYAYSPCY